MTLEEGVNNRVLESNHSIVGFALLADAIDVKYQDVTHSASRRLGQSKRTAPRHHFPEEQPSQNED